MANSQGSQSLAQLIHRHYLRGALLPILTVELVLVVAYFGINAWANAQTTATLRGEVEHILPHLAMEDAERIQEDFARITREASHLAALHQDLLARPDRFPAPDPPPLLAKAPNGSWYQTNRQDLSSWFAVASAPMGPSDRRRAEATAILDPHYVHAVRDVPNVVAAYFNTADNTNRLYPHILEVWKQYPADLRMADYNFYYLADAAHNPERKTVWTGAYLDPAGQGWMVSCVAPVYHGDSLTGVVGLDVTIDKIVKNLLAQEMPWKASAFLADDSGMILAMAPPVEKLLGLVELKQHVYNSAVKVEQLKPSEFNLRRNPDTALARKFSMILGAAVPIQQANIGGRQVFLVQSRIRETGWHLFLVAESEEVFQSVQEVASRSRTIGWVVVTLMLLFYVGFFTFLRSRARRMAAEIARPLSKVTEATALLGTASGEGQIRSVGIQEIDQLSENFNTLARDLESRSQELIAASIRETLKDKEAELAFARGQFESASGYIHNIGNFTVRLGTIAQDLLEIAASGQQYPEVFQRLRSEPPGPLLDRLEEVLVGKTFPRIQAASTMLTEVRTLIHGAIEHQQRSFLEGPASLEPGRFDLSATVARACEEFQAKLAGSSIRLEEEIEPGIYLRNLRFQIQSGILNALKNACEAIGSSGGTIRVRLHRQGDRSILEVVDDGTGIAAEHRERILTAGFTTKPWGHGLGLHSLAVFLSAHQGKVSLHSEGPGRGAQFRMELGDV